MGRPELEYERTRLSGGLNEDPESSTFEDAAQATNLWRPGSRVEKCPGYVGQSFNYHTGFGDDKTLVATKYVSGGFTDAAAGVLGLADVVAGPDDYFAVGFKDAFESMYIAVTGLNAVSLGVMAEYYNGTAWVGLHINWTFTAGIFLSVNPQGIVFARPQDWAAVSLNSVSKYWIRFRLVHTSGAAGTVAMTAGTEITVTSAAGTGIYLLNDATTTRLEDANMVGLVGAQFPGSRRYCLVYYRSDDDLMFLTFNDPLGIDNSGATTGYISAERGRGGGVSTWIAEPPTIAMVPQFGEAYVAYDTIVSRMLSKTEASVPTADNAARVEDRDFAVGPQAPYAPEYIAQLQSWPRCNYTLFFAGRLWAVGLLDEPYTVRWSAAAPYYRVWPTLSFEYLMENDNSPITGIASLGEHVVIFKRDSIWIMVSVGLLSATETMHYIPKKIVGGIGCVSNASIQEIRGRLIFLSEDGIYAFDGTPNIRKVTENQIGADRIQDTIASMRKGRKRFACSVHWSTKDHYLLAFSDGLNGDENNKVIVWNYHQDSWWVWDGIKARGFLRDEGAFNEEVIYFFDQYGRIYKLGTSLTTNHGGTITSTLRTQRAGFNDVTNDKLRSVRVCAHNKTRELTLTGYTADQALSTTGTLSFTDAVEKDWGTFNWGDNWASPLRRTVQHGTLIEGEWVDVKLVHSTKGQEFKLSFLDLGMSATGIR